MTGGGRSRRGDGDDAGDRQGGREGGGFADRVGDDVVPLSDRDDVHPPPAPARRTRAPAPPPVPFVREEAGRGRARDVSARTLARLARADPAPEREVDLHGLDARAAAAHVVREIEAARAEGLRCLLVIHGRGRRSPAEAVLREGLPEWLTRPPLDRQVQAWSLAPQRLGGAGASLVLLRRERRRDA